jgi:sulfite exporter TauE/SafE
MQDTLITFIQLFIIGLTFGMSGPCLLSCTPILLTYLVSAKEKISQSLIEVFLFSLGRLFAYLIQGYLAGLSGKLLRDILSRNLSFLLRPSAGLISIVLGFFILFSREKNSFLCRLALKNKKVIFSSVFILGFIIGIAPCSPLLILLSQIALISENAFSGMRYALFFGLGTFLSGFIIIGGLAGIFKGILQRFLKSERGSLIFRIICASMLFLMGLNIIIKELLFFKK